MCVNDDVLKIIYDIQDLLDISYQEAYKIVDEYIYYGDVDLSDFDEIDDISQLIPKDVSLSLNIRDNKQESISQLTPRDREVLLNIIQNQSNTISKLSPKEHELLVQIRDNKRDINTLTIREKQVLLNILNNDTKIDLLTTKSSGIDLDVSKSDNDSVQLLDIDDKELSIDIEFGEPTTPNTIDLDNINPLSIRSISSIYHNETNVNHLDILTLSDVSTIKEIEQQELKPLSLGKLPNISEFNVNEIDKLSLGKLANIHELNVNEIDSLSLGKIPSISMKHELLKYVPYLSLGVLPSVTPINIDSIDTLQLSKLDNFKWGRINARVKRKELPLLSLKDISDVKRKELSELEELVLFDIPEHPNFDIQPIKVIEYDSLHLDDNLDILNEIIKSDILPPTTKEDFINAGADEDTVHDLYDTYRENSESYNKTAIDVFFQYAITAKDEAIAGGGKEKGLYKIVTEERETFLPFITELYMTELCQYDYNPGLVIQEFLKVIKSFLVVEAEKYNLEVV